LFSPVESKGWLLILMIRKPFHIYFYTIRKGFFLSNQQAIVMYLTRDDCILEVKCQIRPHTITIRSLLWTKIYLFLNRDFTLLLRKHITFVQTHTGDASLQSSDSQTTRPSRINLQTSKARTHSVNRSASRNTVFMKVA
jgi:hypothetical protein